MVIKTRQRPSAPPEDTTPLTLALDTVVSGNFMEMALPVATDPHQSIFVKNADTPWTQLFTLPHRAIWWAPKFVSGVFRIACLEKRGMVYTSPDGNVWKPLSA